jgi:DNA polymerase V
MRKSGGLSVVSCANTESKPQRFALVDCNNFYVSCERVFRPDWEGRPVVVLSNNDGCVIARSQEVKDLGVAMGAPYYTVRGQLAQAGAIVVSSNFTLYGDMSARVMRVLADYAPEMEVYSIDECWLDWSGLSAAEINARASAMVRAVRRMTGIPVSVGIGPSKTLAKQMNRWVKKQPRDKTNGCMDWATVEDTESLLAASAVGDIWGVGRRLQVTLERMGIRTALDLRNAQPARIRRRFGVVVERIIYELRGLSCLDLEAVAAKKSIVASRSFGQPVETLSELSEAIALHTTRAMEKLRSQGSLAAYLAVFIRTNRFAEHQAQYNGQFGISLPVATDDSGRMLRVARHCLERCYRRHFRYNKAGVMLADISSSRCEQTDWLTAGDGERQRVLMRTLDGLNKRYGSGSVFSAAQGIDRRWQMRREFRTQAYTTRWSELPLVR